MKLPCSVHGLSRLGSMRELPDIHEFSAFLNVAIFMAFNENIIKCINVIQLTAYYRYWN